MARTATVEEATGVARFRAVLELGGRTATGIHVPDAVVEELGAGKRPAVVATVAGHPFRSTLGSMGGRAMLPVSAEHRAAAGVAAGDEVDVELVLDTAPRTVELPDELVAALADHAEARAFLDGLTASQQRTFADGITSAKTPETRAKRVAAAVTALREGRKRP